jgi:hypothetical protein
VCTQVCKILIAAGADLSVMSTDGESPVYFLLALPPSAELAEIFATVVEKVQTHKKSTVVLDW